MTNSLSLDYLARLKGCWMGKNYGGAVGMPFEGCPGPRLDAAPPRLPHMVPNDDLEMQLIALFAMESSGKWPDAAQMADLWLTTLAFAPDEYGVALRNLDAGLLPPASGGIDNWFKNGMGAVIRSEIWACLRPADPQGAAILATNDASIDHAEEGVYGAAFLAALQSAAFTGVSVETCIEQAAACIPAHSEIHSVIAEALRLADPGMADAIAIQEIHARFKHPNFTDCLMNLAFILLALLRGRGELNHSLQLALFCGEDADCTGASVAATLGILKGEELAAEWAALPEKIEISPNFADLNPPATIDELTHRLASLREELASQPPIQWDAANTASPFHHEWLVLPSSDAADMPPPLLEFINHPENSSRPMAHFTGVHGSLSAHCPNDATALHLVAWFSVPTNQDAWLLVTASAGLTVWLDDRMIGNYHGRRSMIPAFHRTEGGCCIPVSLRAGFSHQVHLRLLYPEAPCEFYATLGNSMGWHLTELRFRSQS